MHRILQECPKDGIKGMKGIKGVFGHLHDLDHYYREYRMQDSSRHPRDRELDACISSRYEYFSDITVPGRNIIHGDAKLGNMIFRNGKTVGFIDLDTIMEGSCFDDIADCMRSCRVENDGEKIWEFLVGYEEGANISFTEDAVDLVLRNYHKNRFMLGMRYYTDYLAGNVYFRESYPGESLEKAGMNMLS
jgi:Ser/Thr protein kinase RdoA (MazF antagonist)